MGQRKYEPIWERLKNRDTVLLDVAPIFVKRVKRMVSKEKDMDLGFKLLNEDERFVLRFSYEAGKQQLRIKLIPRFGIEDKII
jgi:hypothetical protein